MMEERNGDVRIYVITTLFFACLVSGGILLALYMFLPVNNVKSWYPIVGMVLVAMPWAFWFLTCIYRCITRPVGDHTYSESEPRKSSVGSPFSRKEEGASRNPPSHDDEPHRPSSDGRRHVHFGGVVVLSDGDHDNRDGRKTFEVHSEIKHEEDDSVNSRESEAPLKFSLVPKI